MSRLVGAAFAFALCAAPALASAAPPPAPAALTAQDLDVFLDGFVPETIARADIAGATVSIVKDGKIVTIRNYGFADVAAMRPVTNATLFRPGSISKLMTWTAVMQQVERGKLDLDRDVNGYLDFTIPAAFDRPITLRDLMTHTGGFEETFKDEFLTSANRLEPIGEYLRTHIPTRIYPPGQVVAYSNYGATLAGYIVERVSGQPYDAYVENNIFRPLGMTRSTMRQPLPPAFAADIAKGYAVAGDPATPFEYIQVGPAGSLTTTSTDMTKFMIAHLQDGRLGEARILSAATARRMHSLQHTEAPGFPGFDLGFYQENRNGLRIIGHAGDTNVFHSDLHLLLDKHVGFYVSFNSAGKDGAVEGIRTELFRAFLDRYYPAPTAPQDTNAGTAADANAVQGWYVSTRRELNAFALVFLAGEGQVSSSPDGTIAFSLFQTPAGSPKHWREVAPFTYREVGGPGKLVFVRRGDQIDYLTTDDFVPVYVYARVPFWQRIDVIKWIATFALATFLVTLVVWPIGALVRRHYRAPLPLEPAARRWRLVSRLACAVCLLDVLAWVVFVGAVDKISIPDYVLTAVYAIGVLCLLGALGSIANSIFTWRSAKRSLLAKLAETLPALAGIAFAWLVLGFGLANFNSHY